MYYFETIKCYGLEASNLFFHERRISETIGLNINLREYIYPINNKLLRCKVIYDESGILKVDYFPYKKRDIKSFKLIFDEEINYSKKYLNRDKIDSLFSRRDNRDEIIIVKNALITDTSIANVTIFDGKNWLTPKSPLLKGTVREKLLSQKKIHEANISVQMLKEAKKIALMNAMIGFDILKKHSFFL